MQKSLRLPQVKFRRFVDNLLNTRNISGEEVGKRVAKKVIERESIMMLIFFLVYYISWPRACLTGKMSPLLRNMRHVQTALELFLDIFSVFLILIYYSLVDT